MCGDAFATLYTSYEAQGRFVKRVKARELWYAILDAQMETGKRHNYDLNAGVYCVILAFLLV